MMMQTIRPRDETELAEAIRQADRALTVRGGGTRALMPVAGAVLETSGLSGIALYEPAALTLVVRAGTALADVEAALSAEGQRLPFEPPDFRALLGRDGGSTIGGVAAANASGPRRVQVGACRDAMIGVRFVDGTGTVVRNGGRVMKNVTGYDLVKLMAGSWGTLGVLSEVAFKVLALPETEATLVYRGKDAKQAVATLCAALGTPFDVSGAAHLDPGVAGADSRTQVRIEGLAASVAYRARRLREGVLAGFDLVEGAASAALWREVRDVSPFAARDGAVWRVSVRPTDGPHLTEALEIAGVGHAAIHDWGGGLVWLLTDAGGDAGAAAIRTAIAGFGGHATLFRAPPEVRRSVATFQPEPAAVAALGRGLRARFDPRGLFNPEPVEA